MDDPVHVEVEVVEFEPVRVRPPQIDGDEDPSVDLHGLLLDHVRDRERVPIREPSVERWNSHGGSFVFFFLSLSFTLPLSLSLDLSLLLLLLRCRFRPDGGEEEERRKV